MIDQLNLVKALWSAYLPMIRSGTPVYFTFHKELLIKLFEEHGIGGREPSHILNEAAREWIEIDGDSVVVRPEAFLPNFESFSAAIILVAQQILVVEEMAKDRLGFSEDAYFPRLRRAMSPNLTERSLHPFSTSEDFEWIWRKFRSEILSAGGTPKSITFFAGKHSNRNRSFPLSQALLSQEDIFKIIRLIGQDRVFNLNQAQLSLEIRNVKARLTKRGQKTLGVPFLIDRIYQQIRSYSGYSIPEQQQVVGNLGENFGFTIRIYKDQVDFGQEEFRIGFFDSNLVRVLADTKYRTDFRLLLQQRRYMFFCQSELGDAWIITSDINEINKGESLIVIADDQGKGAASSVLKRFFPELQFDGWIPVSSFEELLLCSIESLPDSVIPFRLKDGKVLDSVERVPQKVIQWIGGVCVNERTNKYLIRFLPDKFSVNGIPALMLGPVKINGRLTTFELFFDSIRSLKTEERFEIELLTGAKGILATALPRESQSEKRGYQLKSSGKLSPTVNEMPLALESLQGFTAAPVQSWRTLSTRDLVLLIRCKEHRSVAVELKTIELVTDLIRNTDISGSLKSFLIARLQNSNQLPEGILDSLKLNI